MRNGVSKILKFSGRPITITDGIGNHTFEYNTDGSLKKTGLPQLIGYSINNTYDNLGRQTEMKLMNGSATVTKATYTYDANSLGQNSCGSGILF